MSLVMASTHKPKVQEAPPERRARTPVAQLPTNCGSAAGRSRRKPAAKAEAKVEAEPAETEAKPAEAKPAEADRAARGRRSRRTNRRNRSRKASESKKDDASADAI